MAPARVLLAVSQLAPCGVSDLILHLVEALDRERFAPSVLALYADDAPIPDPDAEAAGAARFARLGVPVRSMLLRARGSLRQRIAPLVRLLREGDFHVVHAHSRPADLWLTLAGFKARTPVRLYTRQATYGTWPFSLRVRYALLARFATRVVAVSDAVHRHLRRRELVPRRRLELVLDGIPFASLEHTRPRCETRERLGIAAEAPLVTTVASLTARKGHRFLVSAAERVLARHPETRFLFVGEGPERAALEATVQASVRPEAFRLVGERADYADCIAASDLYVLPSLWEGLNLSLLTACALGVPVVASNVGSNPEIIRHGLSGLLPTPRATMLAARTLDPQVLGDAIADLLADRGRAASLGAAARAHVRAHFSAERMAARHETLYTRLLQERGLDPAHLPGRKSFGDPFAFGAGEGAFL
jgi:glycosyltransferase involved in cell wall biosynthesis